jgi:hypothetical protein
VLQTEEFLFFVCWCDHLSVLCCFFQPRQRSFFSAKGVENAVSVVCGLDFLCEESGLFLFARFAFVGDRRLESVAESGGVLFPF